jgi:putative inorganic carbon (hco3(-)) transporter
VSGEAAHRPESAAGGKNGASQSVPRVASRAGCVVLQLACVAVVAVFIPAGSALGYDQFALPKELVIACAPLVAVALAVLASGSLRLSGADAALLGFVLLSAASLAQAPNQTLAWRAFAVSAGGVAAFVAARAIAAMGHRRALLVAVALAGVVGACSVLLEAHGLVTDLSLPGRAPGGTEGNRNYAAHIFVLVVPLLLTAGARARGLARVAALAALVLLGAALLLSRSRGAWLGGVTAVMLCSGLMVYRRRANPVRLRRLAVPLAACAIAAVAATCLPNRLAWRSTSPYVDTLAGMVDHAGGSGRGRIIQYRNTLALIADAPVLGVGPGNWSLGYPAHASQRDPSYKPTAIQPVNRLPNSDWLGLAAERGLLALLCLLVAGAVVARDAWTALRRDAGQGGDLSIVAVATLAGAIVAGQFDAVLLRPTSLLIAAVVVGATAGPRTAGNATCVRARPAWRRVLAAAVAAAALGLALRLAPGMEAAFHRRAFFAQGDVSRLERAASATPDDFRVQLLLAAYWFERGVCDRAGPRARLALAAFPHSRLARRVLTRCGAAPSPAPPAPPG